MARTEKLQTAGSWHYGKAALTYGLQNVSEAGDPVAWIPMGTFYRAVWARKWEGPNADYVPIEVGGLLRRIDGKAELVVSDELIIPWDDLLIWQRQAPAPFEMIGLG